MTENLYRSGDLFETLELAEDPRAATRGLLDHFMVPILSDDSDIVGWVKTLSYH